MERLIDTDRRDPVGEALRAVRVRSTMYCRSTMTAPWGFAVEAHGQPAFHLVADGACWLDVDGEPDQLRLAAGDLVVLPTGRRHALRDDPSTPTTQLDDLLRETPLDDCLRLRYGGAGAPTELLCGGFTLEGEGAHPILRALPELVHIRGTAGRPARWVAASVEMISAEMASEAPGAETVIDRLAESLLTQVVRLALADPEVEARVLASRDAEVGAALELIHSEPGQPWTVGALAEEVGLSRSAFAARFREGVGESPKRYLTRCRLAHAATLLGTTDLTLAEVALRAGYETEFSLSKAFKREFGMAPGAYRGQGEPSRIELAS